MPDAQTACVNLGASQQTLELSYHNCQHDCLEPIDTLLSSKFEYHQVHLQQLSDQQTIAISKHPSLVYLLCNLPHRWQV
jgi:hypothetical protein